LYVNEYSWPSDAERRRKTAASRWTETVEVLPEGRTVTGAEIGQQPFGVFVDISGTPGAIGLAKITSMPRDAGLPAVGAVVRGTDSPVARRRGTVLRGRARLCRGSEQE
jgi:hypothetical protein